MEQAISKPGVSVVIPTWNRSELLECLLESLDAERTRYAGPMEIIVVDSSQGNEKESIMQSCSRHNAAYYAGDRSVRRKRNLAVQNSSHELLLFLDSDVVAEPNLVQAHVDAYKEGDHIGAVQGLTKFVGTDSFIWKCVERSCLVSSFDNAAKYPYQSWSITNNLSVKRSLFNEIGGFLEDLPFELGGDDLEMSYRISKTGKMIASAPDAIALHSKQTWKSLHAVFDRTRRWGTMESIVSELHPEIYRYIIPKNYVFEFILLTALLVSSAVGGAPLLAALAGVMLLVFMIQRWIREMRESNGWVNPIYLLFGSLINARYEAFRLAGFCRKGHYGAFMHGLIFNPHQVMGSYGPDSKRMALMLFDWACTLLAAEVILHVLPWC